MIDFFTSRSGSPTFSIDGVRFHSSYDPAKEASRFIDLNLTDKNPSTIILLGEGLGYLSNVIKIKYPQTKLVTIFYSAKIFYSSSIEHIFSWHPDMRQSLYDFLKETIDEFDLEGLYVIEWPAAASLFPDISLRVNKILSQVIKELRGNLVTTAAMGRLWIRNTFLNYVNIDHIYTGNPVPEGIPVFLAASGPELENALDFLNSIRNRVYLISLPSALQCLAAHRIIPDMIVITDPGYYSIYHLRWNAETDTLVSMPFSAVCGIWRYPLNVFPVSQEYFFEQAFFSGSNFIIPLVPPRGTVAATALDLALNLSNSKIIISGLDFCFNDLISHSRPHSFDLLFHLSSYRLTPFYSQKFRRTLDFAPIRIDKKRIRTSLPLKTYKGWFDNLDSNVKKRIVQFKPSSLTIQGVEEVDENIIARNIIARNNTFGSEKLCYKNTSYPDFNIRKKNAKNVIKNWITQFKELENKLKNISFPGLIKNNFSLFQLLYFIETTDLAKIKRNIRLSGKKATRDKLFSLIERSDNFLQKLLAKINKIKAR